MEFVFLWCTSLEWETNKWCGYVYKFCTAPLLITQINGQQWQKIQFFELSVAFSSLDQILYSVLCAQYTFLCSSMRPLSCIMRQEHILHTQLTKMILNFKAQKTMENKSINSHAQDTTAIHPNVFLTGIHCSYVINRQWSDFPLQNNCQCPSH